jgi:hypothetical protein
VQALVDAQRVEASDRRAGEHLVRPGREFRIQCDVHVRVGQVAVFDHPLDLGQRRRAAHLHVENHLDSQRHAVDDVGRQADPALAVGLV